jgi:hypothetical protein
VFEIRAVLDVDFPSLRRAVGGGSYAKGSQPGAGQAVHDVSWDRAKAVLRGTVSGERGARYRTAAKFESGTWPARYEDSWCTCQARAACRHVVALICSEATAPESAIDLTTAVPAPRPACSLDGTRSRRDPVADAPPRVLLGIEVAVESRPRQAPRLVARLAERGPCGDWRHGDLTFGTLETVGRGGKYPAPQVELARELCALYLAGGRELDDEVKRRVDLSAIDSDRLWDLLDEAAKLNLPLVYAETGEELLTSQEGRFHLDIVVRRPGGGYRMTPVVLTVDREPVLPVAFIGGQQANGAVCRGLAQAADQPGSWRLTLVRLARPVPAGSLQEQALDGKPREIRASEKLAFRTQQYPWLRQRADIISSDHSFVPPVISAPKLVLFLYPGSAGELDLRWGWDYEIDGERLRSGFERHRDDEEYRSGKAEDDLLRHLDLPLERYGLGFSSRSGASAPQFVPQARLAGKQALDFIAELLPRLTVEPRVRVEVVREEADEHRISRSQRFTAATDEVTGISDWFDLDVPVSVAGQVVPLRLLFVALYRRLEYLELPSGACLPLDGPEVEGLARLIRESRTLTDRTRRPRAATSTTARTDSARSTPAGGSAPGGNGGRNGQPVAFARSSPRPSSASC